jgi:hypothetical protein
MKTLWVLITISQIHQIDQPLPTFDNFLYCQAAVGQLARAEVGRHVGTDDPKYKEMFDKEIWNYECHKIEVPN